MLRSACSGRAEGKGGGSDQPLSVALLTWQCPFPTSSPQIRREWQRCVLLARSSRLRGLVLPCLQTLPGKAGLVARVSTFFPKSSAQEESDSCARKYPSEALPPPCQQTGNGVLAALPVPGLEVTHPLPHPLSKQNRILRSRRMFFNWR